MEVAIISVLFQFPRNSRIMIAVKHAAISASRSTPCIDARTYTDWSKNIVRWSPGGNDPE